MPRPIRVHFPGAVFHVISRGNNHGDIFLNNKDKLIFLSILAGIKERCPFKFYAYCLMSNHFHLLIEADKIRVPIIMHRTLTRYSRYFNVKYRRVGHLFQDRYKSILCRRDAHLLELIRYIHLNPVRASMVKSASDWPWSSHSAYLHSNINSLMNLEFPLSLFHADAHQAREEYAKFINERFFTANPLAAQLAPNHTTSRKKENGWYDHAANYQLRYQPDLGRLAKSLSEEARISLDAIRGKSQIRSVTNARHRLIILAIDRGIKTSDIATFLNLSVSCVSKVLERKGR